MVQASEGHFRPQRQIAAPRNSSLYWFLLQDPCVDWIHCHKVRQYWGSLTTIGWSIAQTKTHCYQSVLQESLKLLGFMLNVKNSELQPTATSLRHSVLWGLTSPWSVEALLHESKALEIMSCTNRVLNYINSSYISFCDCFLVLLNWASRGPLPLTASLHCQSLSLASIAAHSASGQTYTGLLQSDNRSLVSTPLACQHEWRLLDEVFYLVVDLWDTPVCHWCRTLIHPSFRRHCSGNRCSLTTFAESVDLHLLHCITGFVRSFSTLSHAKTFWLPLGGHLNHGFQSSEILQVQDIRLTLESRPPTSIASGGVEAYNEPSWCLKHFQAGVQTFLPVYPSSEVQPIIQGLYFNVFLVYKASFDWRSNPSGASAPETTQQHFNTLGLTNRFAPPRRSDLSFLTAGISICPLKAEMTTFTGSTSTQGWAAVMGIPRHQEPGPE